MVTVVNAIFWIIRGFIWAEITLLRMDWDVNVLSAGFVLAADERDTPLIIREHPGWVGNGSAWAEITWMHNVVAVLCCKH